MAGMNGNGAASELKAAASGDNIYEINLVEYWNILVGRKWLILAVIGGVLLCALILTLLITPIFRASTVLQIERDTINIMNVEGVMPTESPADRDFYQTQYELLRSRSLALRVIQDLRLTENPQYSDFVAEADKELENISSTGGEPILLGKQQARELALIKPLLESLSIEPIRNSRLVRISFKSPDRVLAARVANAYADAFIATNLERRFNASSYASKYLEERLAQLKARLEDSEKGLVQFSEKEKIVSIGDDKPSLSAQNLSDLNVSLAVAQELRVKTESMWLQASSGSGMGLPQTVSNPLIQKLREQRTILIADYQEKLGIYKPEYPDMQRLRAQISEVDRQINMEVGYIRAAIEAEYQAAKSQEQLLRERIDTLKEDVLDLQSRSIQYNILKREAETNRQLYDALLQRYKEIGIASGVGINNISVVDKADVPIEQYSPQILLNLVIGLLLGIAGSVVLVFLIHHLDRTVHTPKELETILQRPVLGIIPKLPENQAPMQAIVDPRSPFSEAYRSVRTALNFSTGRGMPRSLLVTSAGPSEGKSTTAVELARNIAQIGKRVLLIDADLRNPSIHQVLMLSNGTGLSNVLTGAVDFSDAVQEKSDFGINVITSGPLPPSPPELLEEERFSSLLQTVCGKFDIVIIDAPPVLGLADAPLLAHQAEATLLVVSANKTGSNELQVALKRLLSSHAKVLGSLLTGFRNQHGSYGHSYVYYRYEGKSQQS
jgi:capsular exopolysaccharide synthesis family protein